MNSMTRKRHMWMGLIWFIQWVYLAVLSLFVHIFKLGNSTFLLLLYSVFGYYAWTSTTWLSSDIRFPLFYSYMEFSLIVPLHAYYTPCASCRVWIHFIVTPTIWSTHTTFVTPSTVSFLTSRFISYFVTAFPSSTPAINDLVISYCYASKPSLWRKIRRFSTAMP